MCFVSLLNGGRFSTNGLLKQSTKIYKLEVREPMTSMGQPKRIFKTFMIFFMMVKYKKQE